MKTKTIREGVWHTALVQVGWIGRNRYRKRSIFLQRCILKVVRQSVRAKGAIEFRDG
ncbi:MAG: hypothetical protein HC769_24225 [Cyanobacteria bacterium CRU_2_1]|nr:hypothetical protein [Cyanobacteria bacterium CRU_2_1]